MIKLVQKLAPVTLSSIKVQAARDEMQWGEEGPPPLLVKIAPDLSKEDLEDIAAVCVYIYIYACDWSLLFSLRWCSHGFRVY